MPSEQDYRPKAGSSNPRANPDDWLSTTQTITLAEKAKSGRVSRWEFARRLSEGQIRAWASLLIVGTTRWVDAEVPALFWTDYGAGMEENWVTGDFAITVRGKFRVQAFAVFFLSRFEEATGFKDFGRFHREQAVAFKRKLDAQLNARTGERLSRATVHSTLSALRAFFVWLADQPGYKRRISYSDADYFNLSEKEVRIAQAVREKPAPTLEQLHHVLSVMPATTDIERRDRALIAFTMLTGARDGALPSGGPLARAGEDGAMVERLS